MWRFIDTRTRVSDCEVFQSQSQTLQRLQKGEEVYDSTNKTDLGFSHHRDSNSLKLKRAFVLVRRHHGDERCFFPSGSFQSERTLMNRKKNILSLENKKRGKYPFFFSTNEYYH